MGISLLALSNLVADGVVLDCTGTKAAASMLIICIFILD